MKVLTVNVQWTTRSRCDRINAGPVCLNGSHGSHDTQRKKKTQQGHPCPVLHGDGDIRLCFSLTAGLMLSFVQRRDNIISGAAVLCVFCSPCVRCPAELVRCVDKGWKVDGWILDTELELDHPRAVHGCLFISGKNFRFH